jgi:hypothetical protein
LIETEPVSPEIGKAAFRMAIFVVLVAVGLLFALSPGTPEFAVTVLTLLIGVVFLAVVMLSIRFFGR